KLTTTATPDGRNLPNLTFITFKDQKWLVLAQTLSTMSSPPATTTPISEPESSAPLAPHLAEAQQRPAEESVTEDRARPQVTPSVGSYSRTNLVSRNFSLFLAPMCLFSAGRFYPLSGNLRSPCILLPSMIAGEPTTEPGVVTSPTQRNHAMKGDDGQIGSGNANGTVRSGDHNTAPRLESFIDDAPRGLLVCVICLGVHVNDGGKKLRVKNSVDRCCCSLSPRQSAAPCQPGGRYYLHEVPKARRLPPAAPALDC
ncbi:hypothetical protein B0H16DRAFT_1802276, partial [Mycena metata]